MTGLRGCKTVFLLAGGLAGADHDRRSCSGRPRQVERELDHLRTLASRPGRQCRGVDPPTEAAQAEARSVMALSGARWLTVCRSACRSSLRFRCGAPSAPTCRAGGTFNELIELLASRCQQCISRLRQQHSLVGYTLVGKPGVRLGAHLRRLADDERSDRPGGASSKRCAASSRPPPTSPAQLGAAVHGLVRTQDFAGVDRRLLQPRAVPDIQSFSAGLKADQPAAHTGFRSPLSSRRAEGQIR